MNIINEQKEFCDSKNTNFEKTKEIQFVVVSDDVLSGALVEGVRYKPQENMSGWWLTSKDYSGNIEDLKLEHVEHIYEKRKDLVKFLGLPPGYRFFQEKYVSNSSPEDVWFDEDILSDVE